jgi:WD40 repeat protein
VFDRNSAELLYTLDGHYSGVEGRIEDYISSVTHHGQYLYTGGQDGLIKKWNIASGALEMTFYSNHLLKSLTSERTLPLCFGYNRRIWLCLLNISIYFGGSKNLE